jgi:hypothetical protein
MVFMMVSMLSFLLFGACGTGPADTGELGFYVASSVPEHGDESVLEAVLPEFRLSGVADTSVCDERHFQIVALDDQVHGAVAFFPEVTVEFVDDGQKVLLQHLEPFQSGYSYAILAVEGAEPCLDIDGEPLRPFGVEFYIP